MKNFFSSVLSFLLVLVLMAGSGFGVWFFMNKKVKELTEADNTNSVVEFETEDDLKDFINDVIAEDSSIKFNTEDDLKDFINDVIAENQAQETPAEVVDLDHEYVRAYANRVYEKMVANIDDCLEKLQFKYSYKDTQSYGHNKTATIFKLDESGEDVWVFYEYRPSSGDTNVVEDYIQAKGGAAILYGRSANGIEGCGKATLNDEVMYRMEDAYINLKSNITDAKLLTDGTIKYTIEQFSEPIENNSKYKVYKTVIEVEISPDGIFKQIHKTEYCYSFYTLEDAESLQDMMGLEVVDDYTINIDKVEEIPEAALICYDIVNTNYLN